jgi:NADPH2:quinone reductase
MKAVLCKTLDGPDALVVEELPDPQPGPGEVVVRVKAAALNFFDTLITRGKYQYKPPLPFSPGGEMAGVVESVGAGVAGLKPGQRVCAYMESGAVREKIVVRAETLVPVPDAVSDEAAAGVTITYGTAVHGLKDRGQVRPGETVAVLGASGGAGLAAVEIAKLMGARVIAAASSTEKLDICKQHGADDVLNYDTTDLKQGLRHLTGGRGVDVIYDCVGDKYAEPALRAIAWGGRFLVIGFAAGQIPKIPINLTLLKSCAIVGVFWGEAAKRDSAAHRENMTQVLGWVSEGRLKPHVHATYPMERTAEGIKSLETRRVVGKVIVQLG